MGRVRLWLYRLITSAISLNRTAVARAIVTIAATTLSTVVAAIAKKYPDDKY